MAKVETKVIAATAGGGAGAVVGTFLLWIMGAGLWHAGWSAEQAVAATSAVPGPVAALVPLLVTVAGAFLGGYLAPHTPRPDLAAPAGEFEMRRGAT